MTNPAFWEAFWPNAAATLIGVVVGVPVALGLSRWAETRQGARERKRLAQALEELAAAAAMNLDLLHQVHQTLARGQVLTGMSFNLSTWDVVRGEVLHGLRRTVGLRVRIARLFEELALFRQHMERFVLFLLQPPSQKTQLEDPHGALGRDSLMPFAARLISDLEKLQPEIIAERATLFPDSRTPSRRLELIAGVLVALVLLGAMASLVLGR